MTIDARINVIRNNAFFKSLQIISSTSPQVNVNNQDTIQRELRATVKPDPEVDLLTDKLAAYQILDGVEYPLGRYLAAEAPRQKKITETWQITAYGIIYQADELAKIEERLYIPAGTKYTDAIRQQLILAGIDNFFIEPNTAVITEDREDWEPGEKRTTIINTLCDEINYHHAYDDNNGVVQVKRYRRPDVANVDFVYRPGESSILYEDYSQDIDMYSRPNVFLLNCTNPEKEIMTATAVNNDPASPVSVMNVGRRVLSVQRVDNIATLEELQIKADNIMYENLLVPETVQRRTGPNPRHDCFNIVAMGDEGNIGVYQELSWSLKLLGEGEMTRRVKRMTLL